MVFRLLPAAVLNASGLLFFGSFLVMAKNSGGYFSITNFLTVSHGLARSRTVCAGVCSFGLLLCLSSATLAPFLPSLRRFVARGVCLLVCGCFVACGAVFGGSMHSRCCVCLSAFVCGAFFCSLWLVCVVGRMFSRPRCFRSFTGVFRRSAVVLLIA